MISPSPSGLGGNTGCTHHALNALTHWLPLPLTHSLTHSPYTITLTTHSPRNYSITTNLSLSCYTLTSLHSLTTQSRTRHGAPTLSRTPQAITPRSRTHTLTMQGPYGARLSQTQRWVQIYRPNNQWIRAATRVSLFYTLCPTCCATHCHAPTSSRV